MPNRTVKAKDEDNKNILLKVCQDTEHNFVLSNFVMREAVHIFCTKCGNSRVLRINE